MLHGYGIVNNHVPTLKATVMKISAAVSTLLTSLYAVYKASSIVTTLNTSIFRVYNGDNVNDTSGNAQNGTNVGSVTFTTGKVGNAFTFNGSNYISLPNDSLNSLTGDFSISVWVNFGSVTGACDILSTFTLFGGNYYGFELYTSSASLVYSTYNGTVTINSLSNVGAPISINTWYNIVITRKASTGTKMYINGTLNNSNTSTQNPVYTSTNYATIGGSNAGGSYANLAANGTKIDALTIWNKELTGSEVTALYNGASGLEYPFSTAITIDSANDSLGTYNGTPYGGLTYTAGKSGNAFTFNGTNAYVALPNSSFDFTGDFSISAWVKIPSAPSANGFIFSNYNYDIVYEYGYLLRLNVNRTFSFFIANVSTSTVTSTTALALNTWYHITVKRDNTNKKSYVYINGTLEAQTLTSDGISIGYGTRAIQPTIGAIRTNNQGVLGTSAYFNGSVDELNIWNKQLTATEITDLYNTGTGKFYPY